ncbi:platelet-activating factor acetylhydrolase IB subunit alpha2-like [Portunus trituberculatus]|uniref:platelet-activating factor acetylhydrolase IB subunit alpha2-like n=1 Tax=Portunus trituberculatus TaxID=210409 RepID=UPI001E1CF235|nr:platelet-activating factor acetylhydrolase IB subunit alpha2-like [Portunus trituberculatus]
MNPAAVPTPLEDVRGDGRWLSMHNRFVNQAREMEPDVVFVGDSIVANLQCTDVWEKWFAPMHCLNFGIGGDETQHVLWRLKNGELEFIKPKAVVVLVGTNNHEHTAAEVAGGIMEICRTIREKQPQSHIVALTLLPRGEKPNCLREKNSEINGLIKETLRSIEMCQVINIDQDLVLGDGTIDHRDMFDYLHLTPQGYRRAFEPVYLLLTNLLHEDDPPILNNASSALLSPSSSPLLSPSGENAPQTERPATCGE